MNINRHNYEEYFILYWDNELSAEQKQLVQHFVKTNPDLEEEFQLLGQTRFTPDASVLFENKESLLQEANSTINSSNYQEWLISYIDNELSPEEIKTVELFIAAHPSALQELALLQKTKLQPEEIAFPDKSVLYRTERKVRVIEMRWLRVAVAAALILVAGFITLRLVNSNTNKGDGEIAIIDNGRSTSQQVIPDNTSSPESSSPAENNSALTGNEINPGDKNSALKENIVPENQIAFAKTIKRKKSNDTEQKNNDVIASVDVPVKSENDITETNIPAINKPSDVAVNPIDIDASVKSFDDNTVTERNTPSYNNSGVQFANYKEDASDKGGLKGLLRKATRVFERRTNVKTTTDDNKLLVGAFAVSLK